MAHRNGWANVQALRITRPSMVASFTASLSRGSMVWGPIRISSRRLRPVPNLPTGPGSGGPPRPGGGAGRRRGGRSIGVVRRAVACVVVAAAVLVACSDTRPELTLRRPPVSGVPSTTITLPSSTATPTTPAPTTPAPTTTVVGAPIPAVTWQACGEGLECGTMKVLLDPADGSKGTIDLYVERRKALEADQRIGTLLVNPGGPGVAGTQLVEQASFYFSQPLRDRFDIVSWDPRGTGRSIPVDCVDDLDPFLIGADPTPDSPEDEQQAAALTAAFVTGCQTRSGPLLPYLSTQATARDMDTLRQALGEPKVSYFGFSYGSELGAMWATMFPATVRAAVLDGAANPNVGWEGEKTEQAAGLERAFLAVMQSCAADPGCPFYNGGDPVAAYEALSASLDAAPVTGDPSPPAGQPERPVLRDAGRAAGTATVGTTCTAALAAAQKGDVSGLFSLYDAYVRARRGRHLLERGRGLRRHRLPRRSRTDRPGRAGRRRRPPPAGGAPHGDRPRVAARVRRLARPPRSAPAPDGGGRRPGPGGRHDG